MVGWGVQFHLSRAEAGLGASAGSAVSVERLRMLIEASVGPAGLTQAADEGFGARLDAYGAEMSDLAWQARRARDDLDAANGEVSRAQERLRQARASGDGSAGAEWFLGYAVDLATERVAAARHRLAAVDEQRRGADASAAAAIDDRRAAYAAARQAMPPPPRVSAGVRVSVSMPDGTVHRVSAVELAALVDPGAIRAVWEAMTVPQRQQLIDDVPQLIGNLDGIPLRDRHTANVITAQAYRTELEHQLRMFPLLERQSGVKGMFDDQIADVRGEIRSIDAILGDRNSRYEHEHNEEASGQKFGEYRIYDENGRRTIQNGVTLVGFHPLRDSYVTFQGALDPVTGDVPAWMEAVGVVVPGTNSRLAGFTVDLDRGKDLFAKSGDRAGYVVWHGAPMPQFAPPDHVLEAAERGFVDVAAPRLASFSNNLPLPEGTDLVPIGHSYGGTTLATAESLGMAADRVVYVAPAGFGHGVEGLEDFPATGDVPHFVLQARNDWVVGTSQGAELPWWGHGTSNPLHEPGITRLETGYLDVDDPSKGTIESTGPVQSHSTVFEPSSTSVWNITNVVKGDPVSLHHDNDIIRSQAPHSQSFEVPDTGVDKPVELIDPVTLQEVP